MTASNKFLIINRKERTGGRQKFRVENHLERDKKVNDSQQENSLWSRNYPSKCIRALLRTV